MNEDTLRARVARMLLDRYYRDATDEKGVARGGRTLQAEDRARNAAQFLCEWLVGASETPEPPSTERAIEKHGSDFVVAIDHEGAPIIERKIFDHFRCFRPFIRKLGDREPASFDLNGVVNAFIDHTLFGGRREDDMPKPNAAAKSIPDDQLRHAWLMGGFRADWTDDVGGDS